MPQALDTFRTRPIQRPILPDVTVVIPTLGRAILEESLYHIANGSAWPAQVIVVDQGNRVQVADWMNNLQAMGIRALYVPSSERGRSVGLNRGLERVTTRFVAVTDDDCFVAADWLERMVGHLRADPSRVVTGRVEAGGDEPVLDVAISMVPQTFRRPRVAYDTLWGGNLGVSMDTLRRVGFFDEDPCLRTAEDGEWGYRALRAGVAILYAPDVAVRHVGWRGDDQRVTQYGDYARSHGGFYGKYLRKGDLFIALRALVHHLRALRRWMRGLATGDRESARVGRAYFTGLLPGIVAGWRSKEVR